MPESLPSGSERNDSRIRRGLGCGCAAVALAVVAGGIYLGNSMNEGNPPAATAPEHDFSATPSISPTTEETLPEARPTETVESMEPSESVETEATEEQETPQETVEPAAPQEDQNTDPNYGDKDVKDFDTCPWDEANPQPADSNGQVEVWSSCGAPGLLAYTYPDKTGETGQPIKIVDGTKVAASCNWNHGGDNGGYIGVRYNGQPVLVQGPDLGFVALSESCKPS